MVRFKLSEGTEVPKYQTNGASGFDVCAMGVLNEIPATRYVGNSIRVEPGEIVLFDSGITVAHMSPHLEIQVRSRSGIALKQGLIVGNSPGTIDSDYRGKIGIIIINVSKHDRIIELGTRIAQLVIAPSLRHEFEIVNDDSEITDTDRGAGGFGSTGNIGYFTHDINN